MLSAGEWLVVLREGDDCDDLRARQERATGSNISGRSRCWEGMMTYDGFNDSLKGPILIDAEVGRAILGLSVGIHPKEVLSVFPSKSVHLGWTLKQNQ